MKFWEITSGWHTSDDTVQYILTHIMAIFCLIQVFLLAISPNHQKTTFRHWIKLNKWIIAIIGLLLFFNLMEKIIFLRYYHIPLPNIENTWLLFIFYVFSNIIIPISLLAFRKYLDLRKNLLLYSIPIIFFILNECITKI